MCFCSTLALKIILLLLIAYAASMNAMEIMAIIQNLRRDDHSVSTPVHVINLIVNLINIGFFCLGIYAAINNRPELLQLYLIYLVVYCLIKLLIWIVCGIQNADTDTTVTHVWFQANLGSMVLATIATMLMCMRFYEISHDEA